MVMSHAVKRVKMGTVDIAIVTVDMYYHVWHHLEDVTGEVYTESLSTPNLIREGILERYRKDVLWLERWPRSLRLSDGCFSVGEDSWRRL